MIAAGTVQSSPLHVWSVSWTPATSLPAFAQPGHYGHVHTMNGGHVGGGPLRHHHVLGDLDAHLAQRLNAGLGLAGRGGGGWRRGAGGCDCRRRGRRRGRWCGRLGSDGVLREMGFQILFGDAATRAGARHLGEIDIVLARHLADQG